MTGFFRATCSGVSRTRNRVPLAALTLALASSLTLPASAAPPVSKGGASEQPTQRKGKSRKAPPAPPVEGQLSLEEIAVMLSSANAEEMRKAFEGAAALGSPDVIPLIQERVKAGLPPDLLDVAMDSVLLLGDPSAGPIFVALAHHRRPKIRLKAVQALVALRSPEAKDALRRALSDSDTKVRDAAAEGLGDLGAKDATATLFTAFERNVGGAAEALGKLAAPTDVPRIVGYLGRMPLTSLTPALDALMARRDLGEEPRLKVVAQIQELGTSEARGYLEGLSQRLPSDAPGRLRKAIDDAIARIAK